MLRNPANIEIPVEAKIATRMLFPMKQALPTLIFPLLFLTTGWSQEQASQTPGLIAPPTVVEPTAEAPKIPKANPIPEDLPNVTPTVRKAKPIPEAPLTEPTKAMGTEIPMPATPSNGKPGSSPRAPTAGAAKEDWQMEISFRPNQAIQSTVFGIPSQAGLKPWHFSKLERAVGPLHLEYQELRVIVPPKAIGNALLADEVAAYIRQNLNEFLDPSVAKAKPHSFDDRWRLSLKNYLGTIIDFEYPNLASEKGSMVISDSTPGVWALTSVYSGSQGFEGHPVAGTRWMGITNLAKNGSFSLYTKAAIRAVTEPADAALENDAQVWRSFLNQVKAWVESLGGKAELAETPAATRADWEVIRHTHFSPLERWKDIDGAWEVRETRDTKKRFRIEIHDGMAGATLTERSPSGKELKRETQLSGAGPNTWVLERVQDKEVLDFLDIPEELAAEALAANPPSSTLTIVRKGESLQATWKGILIQTNSSKKLDRIVTKSKVYEMVASK
jgi:hypothetical protein